MTAVSRRRGRIRAGIVLNDPPPVGGAAVAVTLPFEFDTRGVVEVILRGVLGLLLVVVVPGLLYAFFVSQSVATAAALLVIAAMVMYFGRLFLRTLHGSTGTITADAVVVRPDRLYGIRLAGPAGTFPIQRFKAVRVERSSAPMGNETQWHERVSLVGKEDTPDILVARTTLDAGRIMGAELAAALHLPLEEQRVPY
jgi:hypothetical protein